MANHAAEGGVKPMQEYKNILTKTRMERNRFYRLGKKGMKKYPYSAKPDLMK